MQGLVASALADEVRPITRKRGASPRGFTRYGLGHSGRGRRNVAPPTPLKLPSGAPNRWRRIRRCAQPGVLLGGASGALYSSNRAEYGPASLGPPSHNYRAHSKIAVINSKRGPLSALPVEWTSCCCGQRVVLAVRHQPNARTWYSTKSNYKLIIK